MTDYSNAARTDKYRLKNNSDLSSVSPELTFGAEYDFFAIDAGYDRLARTYKLNFKSTVDMDSGLKYQAAKEGQVDVIDIFTTDGKLHNSGLVTLEDDKGMWSSYQAGMIVRKETLDKYPDLKTALAKLNNILDDAAMSDLNYKVDTEKQEPEKVAHDYLVEKGILKK
ncbi:glycine betaine ABC transporter substrate-binding protein [Streptococcus constellatus]|uniref:glycine betaine ABC transporter substrate-binding protein n=1 Tax=Streptococcus constellatus TaxID=76860 RepID=UPI0021B43839|nr:glycine betaine ABC transporter substrate-binding protein [Streptococcus constellatus]